MLSMCIFVNSRECLTYAGTLYFVASCIAGSRYFIMPPSEIVNISFPLHFVHAPCNGGLLCFSLHLTHLNCCMLNCLKFPLMSLIRCLSIISLATSSLSVALIFSTNSICFWTFSCIVANFLYAEQVTPAFMSEVSCV